jgi:hypothetical protein
MTRNTAGVCLRAPAIGIVVLVAAGCADLRWHKPGGSAAALEQDLAACQSDARVQASHFASPFLSEWPRVMGVDALGRPVVPSFTRLDSERFLYEHDLTRHCMKVKGYDLVPAEKR